MCSQYAVFPVDKRSKMSELWKRQKREIEKQNIKKRERETWRRRRNSSRNRNNCLETGGQMPK